MGNEQPGCAQSGRAEVPAVNEQRHALVVPCITEVPLTFTLVLIMVIRQLGWAGAIGVLCMIMLGPKHAGRHRLPVEVQEDEEHCRRRAAEGSDGGDAGNSHYQVYELGGEILWAHRGAAKCILHATPRR